MGIRVFNFYLKDLIFEKRLGLGKKSAHLLIRETENNKYFQMEWTSEW